MCALLPGAMGFLHHVEEIIFYLPESQPLKCESSRFCCIIRAYSDFQTDLLRHSATPSVVNPFIISLPNT